MKIVTKPWGKEEWLELNDKYCYKRIYINAGHKTSYQYHNYKHETNYIISGTAEVWLENDNGIVEKTIMTAGDYVVVPPPRKHRIVAITDIILQEVSTPEVDDVIRIEDDTNRISGKIESEHNIATVLILAAGIGSRLGSLTTEINKALLPINNKAIISHIIEKFPSDSDFIITLGYKGNIIREYCEMVFPSHNFTFVTIDNIRGIGSGPGYSTLKCKSHLQRPFYFITCDTLIDDIIPPLNTNWLGVKPTTNSESYTTLNINKLGDVTELRNKSIDGFENAFIGFAGIYEYETFWSELETNIKNGEFVNAFENPSKYTKLKANKLNWLDTGNIHELHKTRNYFNDTPLSLSKTTSEITYKEGHRFIKFIPNNKLLKNIVERADKLYDKIPLNFKSSEHFISYDWQDGDTLYNIDSFDVYLKLLKDFKVALTNKKPTSKEHIRKFYINKTNDRVKLFLEKNGKHYISEYHTINNKDYPKLELLLENLDYTIFNTNPFYEKFHGDLHFDNLVYNHINDTISYIDWRESFAGNTETGDVYYDLAKLYGGCIIPYNKMKNEDNIHFSESENIIQYSYDVSTNLRLFKVEYEKWIIENGYDLDKIKLITAIIFLNMSPLHDEKFSKMLWFKSIEMLHEYLDK